MKILVAVGTILFSWLLVVAVFAGLGALCDFVLATSLGWRIGAVLGILYGARVTFEVVVEIVDGKVQL